MKASNAKHIKVELKNFEIVIFWSLGYLMLKLLLCEPLETRSLNT
jgi:hypothetical protein